MKFKWVLIAFALLGIIGFASLLPFAYSIAREIRRSTDQFPADLARFEDLVRTGDTATLHASLCRELKQSITGEELSAQRKLLIPAGADRLRPSGDYSAFGSLAEWVDADGVRTSDLWFEFWWEDGQHKLRRVMGVLEPNRRVGR